MRGKYAKHSPTKSCSKIVIPPAGGMAKGEVPLGSRVLQGEESGHWAPPDESLLEDRRGELPEFPCDVFLLPLSNWLSRATRGAGVRIDHIAVPMLGVASSLIGKARRVQASTSWIEPTTMWACIVGHSGDRKTPGLQVILRALDRIEEENSPAQRESEHAHQERKQKAKAVHKAWRKACEQAVNAKPPRELPPMPIEAVDPGDFINPALYVTDATIQRLAKLCEVRPRGMMQIRDELSGLFASMARQSGARGFFLEAGTARNTSSNASIARGVSRSTTCWSASSAASSRTS